MKITRVCIKTVQLKRKTRLCGYAFVEFDNQLRVENVRILQDGKGKYFLAMPSIERKVKCRSCQAKVSQKARYCPVCGAEKAANNASTTYKNLVYLMTPEMNEMLLNAVVESYEKVLAAERGGGNRNETAGVHA